MSDCLHCDINELVRERIEGQENVDLADLVARMAESLAETIMLGPKDQWSILLAEAVRQGRVEEAWLDDKVRRLLAVFE